jgi:S1-C subfamily serine protease
MVDISNILFQIKECVIPIYGKDLRLLGTGFLINNKGYLLTCEHVVKGQTDLKTKFNDNNESLNIIEIFPEYDLAILKIENNLTFPFLSLADYNSTKEGQEVFFCGYPLSINKLVSNTGIISCKRTWNFEDSTMANCNIFQLDGLVNRGNSGGPLLNIEGKVIGIIKAAHGYHSNYLKDIIEGRMNFTGMMRLGQIDIGKFIKEVSNLVELNVQLGVGYSVSIDYAKEKLSEIDMSI